MTEHDQELSQRLSRLDRGGRLEVSAASLAAVTHEIASGGRRSHWTTWAAALLVPAAAAVVVVALMVALPRGTVGVPPAPAAQPAAPQPTPLVLELTSTMQPNGPLLDCLAITADQVATADGAALATVDRVAGKRVDLTVGHLFKGLTAATGLRINASYPAGDFWQVGTQYLLTVAGKDIGACSTGTLSRGLLETYNAAFGGHLQPEGLEPGAELSLLLSSGASKCRSIDAATLSQARPAQAFEATIGKPSTKDGATVYPLTVSRWFVGGPYRRVSVVRFDNEPALGSVNWQQGERVLIAADGGVLPCLSTTWSVETAAVFEKLAR